MSARIFRVRVVSTHARSAGIADVDGRCTVHYSDTIVSDGRRHWCVTRYPSGRVTVRPACGTHPYPGSRPMRACGLRSTILEAAS